ncbi:hypothetical protein IQ454_004550 [Salmonella enterica]|nr:hypothetical protein [Salmonella enterica]EGL4359777.1 hypothetical protein [Salmonella enterica]EGL4382730.1 hypothetical protein [Salmonella enterica]EGL4487976.1 hypothetical protein [Salmonella enterica]EGL4515136.1 hypothetical protein [Salmonella enterica]
MDNHIEEIEKIINAHEEKHNRQIKYFTGSSVAVSFITLALAVFCFFGSGVNLFLLIPFIVCLFIVAFFICLFLAELISSCLLVMSRESLLGLIHLIKEDEDVSEILVQRLLTGKFLTGRDGHRIGDLYFKNLDRFTDSVARQQERKILEDFITRK